MADVMVKQGEEPIEEEVLAASILRVSSAVHRIEQSGLTRKALIVLIRGADPSLGQQVVVGVLDALASLERHYLTPKAKGKPASK